MKPAPFEYVHAETTSAALDALNDLRDEAKVMAGGQSLIPLLNFRLATPSTIVGIGSIDELRDIRREGDRLSIGSLVTHRTVEESIDDATFKGFQVLCSMASLIGHLPIRNRGTIGGSIAHADPAAEWPLAALLMDARIVVRSSSRGERTIDADEFFISFFSTALEPDELVISVIFDHIYEHCAIREFARRRSDFAIVSIGVAFDVSRQGACLHPRVVVGGVGGSAIRATSAEQVLAASSLSPAVVREAATELAREISPRDDAHGPSEYRRSLAREMLPAVISDAMSRSGVAVAV